MGDINEFVEIYTKGTPQSQDFPAAHFRAGYPRYKPEHTNLCGWTCPCRILKSSYRNVFPMFNLKDAARQIHAMKHNFSRWDARWFGTWCMMNSFVQVKF